MPLPGQLSVEINITYISSRCQRQCRKPRMRLTRWRRMSAANIGPSLFHYSPTVSWQMSMPRSNSKSSTFRRLSGKRTYIMTTRRITSGEEWKYRNGFAGLRGRPINGSYNSSHSIASGAFLLTVPQSHQLFSSQPPNSYLAGSVVSALAGTFSFSAPMTFGRAMPIVPSPLP